MLSSVSTLIDRIRSTIKGTSRSPSIELEDGTDLESKVFDKP